MKTCFSKEIQVVSKHVKRGSIPLVITEIQIRTNMKCHFTPSRKAVIKIIIAIVGDIIENYNPYTLLMGM